MQDPFIYTNDDVPRMLDVLLAGSGERPCFGEDFLCALLATKERSEEAA